MNNMSALAGFFFKNAVRKLTSDIDIDSSDVCCREVLPSVAGKMSADIHTSPG